MSRPNPILQDMPRLVKEIIVLQMDLFSRFSLRQCSKSYQKIIDCSPITLGSMTIGRNLPHRSNNKDHISFNIESNSVRLNVEFQSDPRDPLGCRIQVKDKPVKLLKDVDYMENAMACLKFILKNPNLKLKALSVRVVPDQFGKVLSNLNDVLSSLNRQLSTETLWYETNEYHRDFFPSFLSNLKPGVLHKIDLLSPSIPGFSEIAKSLQWKLAKSACLWEYNLPIDSLLHFQSVHITHRAFFSLEDVKKVIERGIQSALTKEPFEFSLTESGLDRNIFAYLEQFEDLNLPFYWTARRIEIPNTTDYLELKIYYKQLEIKKITPKE